MTRAMILLLVCTLSGLPAAAVVCDMLLCAQPQASAASCHEHAAAPEGDERLVAATTDCSHLVPSVPFVTVGVHLVPQPSATLVRAEAAQPDGLLRSADVQQGRHGPSPALPVAVLPLRI